MKVYTTSDDLDAIASAIDSSRKNSVNVTVPRQALANLLCDAKEIFSLADKLERKEAA